MSAAPPVPQPPWRFVPAVLRTVGWRAIVFTQGLACLFVLRACLVSTGPGIPDLVPLGLVQHCTTALCVMLAALAADEAVRRGRPIWPTFGVALLWASLMAALLQLGLNGLLDLAGPKGPGETFLRTFFDVGTVWGTVLLVYLNRESSRRILARVRAGELARVQTERRLLASRLSAAEVQVDPVSVRERLGRVRGLYAADDPQADQALDQLIEDLRQSVARGCATAEGLMDPQPVPAPAGNGLERSARDLESAA